MHINAETRVISGWKNDLESCAQDFLRFFTIQKFDQQFRSFLTSMRHMTLAHVNLTNSNSEHQLNMPQFYDSSEVSSRNIAANQGQFNHGELHSQIHNVTGGVTGQVVNNEHPVRMEYEQGNYSNVSSESNGNLSNIIFILDVSIGKNIITIKGFINRHVFYTIIVRLYYYYTDLGR